MEIKMVEMIAGETGTAMMEKIADKGKKGEHSKWGR